ncbi:hypothetical protein HC891_20930 [Candidatus Gracilibacteria bacterium]|nr:hypothetical protein [Candidatus Gracilibacteria bacterium]
MHERILNLALAPAAIGALALSQRVQRHAAPEHRLSTAAPLSNSGALSSWLMRRLDTHAAPGARADGFSQRFLTYRRARPTPTMAWLQRRTQNLAPNIQNVTSRTESAERRAQSTEFGTERSASASTENLEPGIERSASATPSGSNGVERGTPRQKSTGTPGGPPTAAAFLPKTPAMWSAPLLGPAYEPRRGSISPPPCSRRCCVRWRSASGCRAQRKGM